MSGWQRKFEDPIPLPDGGELRTLLDAGNYIQSLPKVKQRQEAWQTERSHFRPEKAAAEWRQRWPFFRTLIAWMSPAIDLILAARS